MSDERIEVGRVGRPHGLHGESTVLADTDDPDRFRPGAALRTDSGVDLVVRSAKPYRDKGLIVRFEGVLSREDAEGLRGSVLTVDADDRRALADDEFWPDDLVGLIATDPSGERLGEVSGVELGPGQDRLVIRTDGGTEVLVPFVKELVGESEGDVIVIDAPEGLFP